MWAVKWLMWLMTHMRGLTIVNRSNLIRPLFFEYLFYGKKICVTYILPLVGIWQSFRLYYFLFVVNRQWKVKNRHVTVGTGMSPHLYNGFLCGHWLVDASTVANLSAYFNKLTSDIPYISYSNPTKNRTHLNIRTWFHMCDSQGFLPLISTRQALHCGRTSTPATLLI